MITHELRGRRAEITLTFAVDSPDAIATSGYAMTEFIATEVSITYRLDEDGYHYQTALANGRRRRADGTAGRGYSERRYHDGTPPWLAELIEHYRPAHEDKAAD